MEKTWVQYYEDKIAKYGFSAYYGSKIQKNLPFLKLIEKYCANESKLIETGLGTSFFIVHFLKRKYMCEGLDIDQGMVDFGKKVLGRFGLATNLYQADIFSSPFADYEYDISFNLGVMEHFSDEEIIAIIKEQTRIAKRYIFAIPSINVLRSNAEYFGDERYLSSTHWESLISKSGVILEKRIGYRFEEKPLIGIINRFTGLFYSRATFFVYVLKRR